MLVVIGVLIVATLAGSMVWVRSLDHDVDRWHVDPVTAPAPTSPNSYRVADTDGADRPAVRFDDAGEAVWAAVDAVAAAEARTSVVADSRDDLGYVTYVQRSAFFGFPDYITIAVDDVDGQTRLSVFSRSRLGQSDLGVNERRVEAWVRAIEARLG